MRSFLTAVLVLVLGASAEAGWRCRGKAAVPCGTVQTCPTQTVQFAAPAPNYALPTYAAPACASGTCGQRMLPNFQGGFSVGTTCGPGGCATGVTGPFGNTVGLFRGLR